MLYIVVPNLNQHGFTSEIVWHVGERVPDVQRRDIIKVQADGDELTYILQNFHNIPVNVKSRVNVWHGDFARFIADNL